MSHPQFVPTADNAFVISYPDKLDKEYDFPAILSYSKVCERKGEIEKACNLRYDAVKRIIDLIPDEDEIVLDWDDEENHVVLNLLRGSAIDHFLIGDFDDFGSGS